MKCVAEIYKYDLTGLPVVDEWSAFRCSDARAEYLTTHRGMKGVLDPKYAYVSKQLWKKNGRKYER